MDISVEIEDVKFENPTVLASGSPSWNGESLKKYAKAGAGAVVPKSIGPPEEWLQHPRNRRMKVVKEDGKDIGMINLELFSTKPFHEWIDRELKIAAEGGSPIITSVVCFPDSSDTQGRVKEAVETGYPAMIELNVSCPMPHKDVGMNIGRVPEKVRDQVKAAKKVADIPVGAKLSPNFAYEDELAKTVKDAGGDFVTATNSIQSLYGVDIDTGSLILRAFGGYSGPAVKPVMKRCVAKIKKNVDIPVIAVGGASNWRDIIEYIMLGAEAVGFVTAAMWKGPEIFGQMVDGITSFMEEKGYEKLDDFRGIALDDLTTVPELAKEEPLHAKIDQDACIGCGMCVTVCEYGATSMAGEVAESDSSICDGCGLCVEFCPVDAIKLE